MYQVSRTYNCTMVRVSLKASSVGYLLCLKVGAPVCADSRVPINSRFVELCCCTIIVLLLSYRFRVLGMIFGALCSMRRERRERGAVCQSGIENWKNQTGAHGFHVMHHTTESRVPAKLRPVCTTVQYRTVLVRYKPTSANQNTSRKITLYY